MKLAEKLLHIQAELKAPKNQRNTFGNYNYRSAEDILEAVKPLCLKHKATLTISDDMIELGTRIYVKAVATLRDIESDQVLTVSANAREEETKKGMDASQITGSASSYARKYALNGMFAIDDTKDSDATNTHGKEETPPKSPTNAPKVEKASQSDVIDLQMVLNEEEIKKVLAYYKVATLGDLPKAEAVKMIAKKRSAK